MAFAYVPQRYQNDCGVAAMAMFMGVTYEATVEMIRALHPEYQAGEPTSLSTLVGVLGSNDDFPVLTLHRDATRPALLCCYSYVEPTFGHAVYWDGERAWDPSPGPPTPQIWLERWTYGQIQRVSDLVAILRWTTRQAVRSAIAERGETWIVPGTNRRE